MDETPRGGASEIVDTFTRDDGQRRVDVFRRPDGTFGFEEWQFGEPEDAWFPFGSYSHAILGSAEDALREARARVRWLSEADE